jgi:bifunctional DNA-binding transcriptional regulator/antitoxin component of YhaV-PrlF toxin-antitoxin module
MITEQTEEQPKPTWIQVTLDEQGRLVLPADFLRTAGFSPGETVDVEIQEDRIMIAKEGEYGHLEIRNGLPVIISPPGTPVVSQDVINEIINRIRDGGYR